MCKKCLGVPLIGLTLRHNNDKLGKFAKYYKILVRMVNGDGLFYGYVSVIRMIRQ